MEVQVSGMNAIAINEDCFCLQGVCRGRFRFEVEYGLKKGTTDNAYLVKEPLTGKGVLIGIPDVVYSDDLVACLKECIALSDITAIVVTHLDPKSIPTLQNLIQKIGDREDANKAQLLTSNAALQLLRSKLGESEEGGSTLSKVSIAQARADRLFVFDDHHQLQFINCSTPRWPDLVCVYDTRFKLLFTSKLFSAHVAPPEESLSLEQISDVGGWEVFGEDWKYYYDCMLAPVAKQASLALTRLNFKPEQDNRTTTVLDQYVDKFKSWVSSLVGEKGESMTAGNKKEVLTVSMLCPKHGPLIHACASEILGNYGNWTTQQMEASNLSNVAVMYASAYGNTAALAQAISRGITKSGVGVEMINLETVGLEDTMKVMEKADGFIVGSPTLGGHMPTQVSAALGGIIREDQLKRLPCGVFGSFGWSGEAVDEMEQKLKDSGYQFAFPAIRVKFRPTAGDLQLCEESGVDLAQRISKIKRQEKKARAKDSLQQEKILASGVEKAMGRVVGSLCVLSVKDEDADSAMLASWVSQASFDPPGLTIAVKKDRACEPLLILNNNFNVNILGQGRDKEVMKQLLKPFKPGQPRFDGIDTETSESNGCVILQDAISVLECKVADRMEAGDHWIIYGQVLHGKLLDSQSLSAVHFRKSGKSY